MCILSIPRLTLAYGRDFVMYESIRFSIGSQVR